MEELPKHQSILTEEIIEFLQPQPDQLYLDATFGGGGHSRALLKTGTKVIAIDRDAGVERFARTLEKEFGNQFRFEPIAYNHVEELNVRFNGAVMDLGLSSDQLESSRRGFSYQRPEEPLDLRFDASSGQTAAQFLSQASLPKIEAIFRDFAQDRYWRRLAGKIVQSRRANPIRTVGDFIAVVGNADPKVLAPLFQALRIVVNDELGVLKQGLHMVDSVLNKGAKLAVISFHSLEDRIVKDFFRNSEYEILTKKPVEPSEQEVEQNPRSRSAKLRVGIKI